MGWVGVGLVGVGLVGVGLVGVGLVGGLVRVVEVGVCGVWSLWGLGFGVCGVWVLVTCVVVPSSLKYIFPFLSTVQARKALYPVINGFDASVFVATTNL